MIDKINFYKNRDFIFEINKFNIKSILPVIGQKKLKDSFEGFILVEHMFITRQFRLIEMLLKSKMSFDHVDGCLIVASVTRTIIENAAVVNYLIHDTSSTKEDKIDVLNEFQNMAKIWAEQNSIKFDKSSLKQYDSFIQQHKSTINNHVWAKISSDVGNTSKLIKRAFISPVPWENITKNKNPDVRHKTFADMVHDEWDSLSKLLHNNQLHRLVFLNAENGTINLNYKNYAEYMDSALQMLGLILLNLFHDLLPIIDDQQLILKYVSFCKKYIIQNNLKGY